MRPLELRIYQPIGVTGWYRGDVHAILPTSKRFTDAELAAEYWRSHSDYYRHGYTEAITFIAAERDIWHRFATHPHWDAD